MRVDPQGQWLGAVKKGKHPFHRLFLILPQKMADEVARESVRKRKVGGYVLFAVGQGIAAKQSVFCVNMEHTIWVQLKTCLKPNFL